MEEILTLWTEIQELRVALECVKTFNWGAGVGLSGTAREASASAGEESNIALNPLLRRVRHRRD